MEKRIVKIDASALAQSSCRLRTKYIVIDGYTQQVPYNDTLYGSAFHKFVATMHETKGDFAAATFAAQDVFNKPHDVRPGKKHLNEMHLTKTCIDYWQYFQQKDAAEVLVVKDKPLVEQDFAEKIFENDKYIILLCGTIDQVAKIKNGCIVVPDFKTHSLWSVSKNGVGAFIENEMKEYLAPFEMSPQLRLYVFVIKLLATRYPDSVWSEIGKFPIGACIIGVFISSTMPTQFRRSDVWMFSERDLEQFGKSLDRKVQQLVWLLDHPEYDEPDGIIQGSCTEQKFLCKFIPACNAKSEEVRKVILKNSFIQKPYDPLSFGK